MSRVCSRTRYRNICGGSSSAAVFLLRGPDQASEPYVGKTSNLRRRVQRLLGSGQGTSRKLNLRDRVRWVEWAATGSDFESAFLLYQVLRREFPKTYEWRLRLRFAPLVKLILDNPYPRAVGHSPYQQFQRNLEILRTVFLAHGGREVCQ